MKVDSEEILRDSESHYRSIFEKNRSTMLIIDSPSGDIVDVNSAACNFYGYTREEFLKLNISDINQLSREEIAHKLSQAFNEVNNCFQFPHRLKNGEIRIVEVYSGPISNGKRKLVSSIVHDVTERKRMEEQISRIQEQLEQKVIERTKDLERINSDLKEEIVKRIQVENALKISEEKYRTVADFTYNWETWVNPEGEHVYVSPACEQLTGYTVQEFLQDSKLFVNIVHPDDRQRVAEHWVLAVDGSVSQCTMEFRIITKTGKEQWIGHRCQSVFNNDGRWIGQRGSNSDISIRKQRELESQIEQKRLNSIVKISQLNSFTLKDLFDYALEESTALSESKLGYIYYYCEETREFTLHSWSKNVMKECSIRNPASGYHLDQTGIWGEAVRQRKPIVINDFSAFNPLKKGYPEGHAQLFRFMTVPVFNKGKIVAVAGVANKRSDYTEFDVSQLSLIMTSIWDIAEHRKVETELEEYRHHLEDLINERTTELENANRQLQKELRKQKEAEERITAALIKEKELNELKSRFVSMISHEYRTPLTGILSSSELMEMYGYKWTEEKRKEHLHKIQKSVGYLTEMLNDVLLTNRVDAGRLEFTPAKIDLIEFCTAMVNEIKSASRGKCNICFNCSSEKAEVFADRKLLHYILNNLLMNAVNYSKETGVIKLTLTVDKTSAAFQIADNGIGIPEEDQQRLFEQFYRGKNTVNIPGTGLGLSIVKSCVNLHKGSIEFSSIPGTGTTFTVIIPIVP